MANFDFGVGMAFWLMIGSAILCIVYGALKWNSDKEVASTEMATWDNDEDKINEEF